MRGSAAGTDRSLEECGKVMGITKERARQLEASALKKIRAAMLDDPDIREYLADMGLVPSLG